MKTSKVLALLAITLCLIVGLFACGPKSANAVSIGFDNSAISIIYGENIMTAISEQLKPSLSMSNGEKKEFTEEQKAKVTVLFEVKKGEEYSEYSIPSDGIVPPGSYRITFNFENLNGYAYIYVDKKELSNEEANAVKLIIENPSQLYYKQKVSMTLSGCPERPQNIIGVTLLINPKNDPNFVSEYHENVTYSNGRISLSDDEGRFTPGEWEVCARISSPNYHNFTTAKSTFTIQKTKLMNAKYGIFKSSGDELTRVTSISYEYDFAKTQYSDYLKSDYEHYVIKVDEKLNPIMVSASDEVLTKNAEDKWCTVDENGNLIEYTGDLRYQFKYYVMDLFSDSTYYKGKMKIHNEKALTQAGTYSSPNFLITENEDT